MFIGLTIILLAAARDGLGCRAIVALGHGKGSLVLIWGSLWLPLTSRGHNERRWVSSASMDEAVKMVKDGKREKKVNFAAWREAGAGSSEI